MFEKDEVTQVLRRIFSSGGICRIPRNPKDAEVLMAFSVAKLDPDAFYDESEMNAHLSSWLAGVSADENVVDHITLRRLLVDRGFLRRSSDGVIYRVAPAEIEALLTSGALQVEPEQLLAEVTQHRKSRVTGTRKDISKKEDRRQIKKDYLATPKEVGVYRIRNTVNGKSYVASSTDIRARFNRHRMALKTGSESVEALLADWADHGADAFEFEIVDLLEPLPRSDYDPGDDLEVLEALWLDKLQPFEPDGYNRRRSDR